MDTPARKNHNFIVKVRVPQKVSATIFDMESYQNWMSSTTTTMKETGKGQKLELSDLPYGLMESLLERLSSGDRIRFGATCKKNLSFFVTNEEQHHPYRYQFRTIDKLPWMVVFYTGWVDWETVFRLYEPRQQRGQPHYADYLIDPEGEESLGCLIRNEIKACKKGWFLLLFPKEKGMTSFLLFCPFNKRIITLPDLDHDVGDKNNILGDLSSCGATFSSDDPSSSDCVFFFLSPYSTPGKHKISTLDQKSGKWKTKLFDKVIDDVCSVVYHEGCFYCRSFGYELAAYDVIHQTWNLITAPSFPLFIDVYDLVACEGKLLLAFVGLASYEYNNLEAFRCSLFEFNGSTSSWAERTSLGDHALFLGHPNSFTVPVPSGSSVADRMYFYSSTMKTSVPIYYSFRDGRCRMSENGDYWFGVESGMWIEPLPTS